MQGAAGAPCTPLNEEHEGASMSSSRIRKRAVGAVAGLITASLALAACGSSEGSSQSSSSTSTSSTSATSATSSAAAGSSSDTTTSTGTDAGTAEQGVDDGTKLTLWTRAPLEKQAKALVEAYNASHQNQVEATIVPNDDYVAKVGAAAGAGQLPDLFAADIVYVPNWTSQGLFADISDRIDGLPYADQLNQGHIDAGTYDGKKYVTPFVLDLSVMMWNKDLYKEAGLDPEQGPTTVAEYVDHAKKVAALGKDGVSGSYFGGNCGGCLVFTWFPMIWASGDQVMNAEGTESLLASDTAKTVYNAYKDLVNTPNGLGDGYRDETGATWVAGFQEGKVGVMPYPATLLGTASESVDVGVAPLPGVDGGESTFVGGDGIGISKDSKVTDQAWNFLAWLTSEEAQVQVLAKGGDVVSRSDLASNEYSEKDPRLVTINEVAGKGQTPIAVQFQSAFNAPDSPWLTLVRNAVFGDGSSIDSDNDEITAVLDQ
jgi:multiple sugar transport system substrate-binding protein